VNGLRVTRARPARWETMTPRRHLPLFAALLAAAGLAAAVPAAQARDPKISAAPTRAHAPSTIRVSFRSPDVLYGSDDDEYERYRVTLFAPKGCASGATSAITSGTYDIGDRVVLDVRSGTRAFCRGVWRGKVTYEEYLADTEEDCPDYPEAGSTMCEDVPTGTYSKLRLGVASFKVRVR
jgi:hypothetical protein